MKNIRKCADIQLLCDMLPKLRMKCVKIEKFI